jgi:SurA N-terminal domain
MINFFLILSTIFTVYIVKIEAAGDSLLIGGVQEPQIIVNNRIVAKVNGKAISVMDLMKKMDILFYRQFPQYASSSAARYQFYQANWSYVLSEMIDKELILADAEEAKLVVSAGDIRQEIESLFGPNLIENLDIAGLTLDEASKMILADIIIRRMMYIRVQAKAINQVTPSLIRKYYDDVAKENIRDNEWVYSLVSIRHRDSTKAAEMANRVHHLLSEEQVALPKLDEKLSETAVQKAKAPTVSISEEFHIKEKELSDPFKQILLQLTPGSYSAPIAQKSRADNSMIYRIFYLKEMIQGGVVPFNELESKIKDRLLEEAIAKETEAYILRLRRHFDVRESELQEILSSEYQPFFLK